VKKQYYSLRFIFHFIFEKKILLTFRDKSKIEMNPFYSPVLVNDEVEAERVEIGPKKDDFVLPPKSTFIIFLFNKAKLNTLSLKATGLAQQVNFLDGFDLSNLLTKNSKLFLWNK
jgi:hypothetical protein